MIARLQGILLAKQAPRVLLDVAGVGYEISVPMTTYERLPETGQQVILHTHFLVREEVQALFGFIDPETRAFFRVLLKMTGVGPKMALTILSKYTPQQLIECVHLGDARALTSVPGIGAKTAERLLVDLKQRLDNLPTALAPSPTTAKSATADPTAAMAQAAIEALMTLGYKPNDARTWVLKFRAEADSTETLIRLALQAAAN